MVVNEQGLRAYLISDGVRSTARQLETDLATGFEVVLIRPVFVEEMALTSPEVVDDAGFRARHLRSPLRGEVGVALAHRNVYAQFLSSGEPWALVVEDDVVISEAEVFGARVLQLVNTLPAKEPVIVNLNVDAADPHRFSRKYSVAGLWQPSVATYTASCYLLNARAAEKLHARQFPVCSQADWPVTAREVLFLQESMPIARPADDQRSLVDPHDERGDFALGLRLQMWSGIWFVRHRKYFRGLKDYWNCVLKPRLYRHIY